MDVYVANPQLLKGKPKNTLGDYVKSQGILVPRRFQTFDEARNSGVDFLVRSEHPQDYSGASNLFYSVIVRKKDDLPRSLDEIWKKACDDGRRRDIDDFARLTGQTTERVLDDLSFSFWEYLGGQNRAIIADSAIEERYHIFTFEELDEEEDPVYVNYSVIERGKIISCEPIPLKEGMEEEFEEIIEFYERIRGLPNFDANHCPIVEFQTYEGQQYFLQYHRTRDFKPATFTLSRKPELGEIEVDFSRGATPEEGITAETTLFYGVPYDELELQEDEVCIHHPAGRPRMFTELMALRARVQIIMKGPKEIGRDLLYKSHTFKSLMFKPELFIAHENATDLITDGEMMWMGQEKRKEIPKVTLRAISDGRKTYIKRV